jgi:hypothetical protein
MVARKEKKMKIQKNNNKFLIGFVLLILLLSFNIVTAESQPPTDKRSAAMEKTASVYQGTLTGYWTGELMGLGVSGSFTAVIAADGKVSGTYEGIESGTITGTGFINAKGSAYIHGWTGQVNSINGRLSGKGTWTGYGITGSWSGG